MERSLVLYVVYGSVLSRRAVLAIKSVKRVLPQDVTVRVRYVLPWKSRERYLPALIFRVGKFVVYKLRGPIDVDRILDCLRRIG